MPAEKCPVCSAEMKQPKMVNVEGKTMRVCSDGCAAQAKKNPQKFGSKTQTPVKS